MRRNVDAATVLTAYLAILVFIPSRLTIGPLGGAGSPALLIGLGAMAWWIYYQLQRSMPTKSRAQPVRIAFFIMAAAFLMSYVVAMTRTINSAEASTANLGMLGLFAVGGILLVANDGIPTRSRFNVLVRRVVLTGGALATLGVIQFITGQSWVDKLTIPGLSLNQSLAGLSQRAGFNRPAGTALHPIEFGAVITMILPLAINLALTDRSRNALRRWFPVLAIALATVMSISRSALVGAVLGIIVLAVGWPPLIRRLAVLVTGVFAVGVFVTIPGMVGTLTGLFTGIGDDTSASSRTGSYEIAAEFIHRSPVFGRGFSTFLPGYRILDNEYLLLMIEVGVVGLACFIGLLTTAFFCARFVRRFGADAATRQMGQAFAASVSVGVTGFALFDGFSFPMSSGMLFLIVGLCGAFLRLVRQNDEQPELAVANPCIRAR